MSVLRIAIGSLAMMTLASSALGQVVQLPTFNYFTIQTSVLAPDSGRGYLGGARRGAYGRSSRGVPGFRGLPGAGRLFGDRALGAAGGTRAVSVRATIIDHDQWDQAILAAASAASDGDRATRSEGTGHEAASGSVNKLQSLAEIRRQNSARQNARSTEAERLLAQGDEAESEGKYGVARIFYRMAAKKASGALSTKIAARLAAIDAVKPAAAAPAARDR